MAGKPKNRLRARASYSMKIDPLLRKQATAAAKAKGETLPDMVERLLLAELDDPRSYDAVKQQSRWAKVQLAQDLLSEAFDPPAAA